MTPPFDEGIGARPALGLADVTTMPVRERFDRKYLVPVRRLDVMLSHLEDGFGVLEVDGERVGRRRTVYFDTPDLTSYHAHRQERRRRYKIRTRHYGDPSAAMLEVKCKGGLGETAKFRRPHPAASPERLNAEARAYVAMIIRQHYDLRPRLDLIPTLETDFVRVALIDLDLGERLTVDRDITITTAGRRFAFDRRWAIVEAKSARRHPRARRALHRAGARPGPMSKYCLGIAVSRPGLPSNRWSSALRRLVA